VSEPLCQESWCLQARQSFDNFEDYGWPDVFGIQVINFYDNLPHSTFAVFGAAAERCFSKLMLFCAALC
jgi:hypothetical protein